MSSSSKPLMSEEIAQRISACGAIAVIVLDDADKAVPLAQALYKGGVNCIELTLRTPAALESARRIKEQVPEVILGIGTVLTKEQVKDSKKAGADFAVAPGCNPTILQEALRLELPFAPGIMTPSDIEQALQFGCRILKYFPAETSGGLKNLQSMAAPYKHLGLQFIPLGGVNQENAAYYLNSPLICAIGGSWIAKAPLIAESNWSQITTNASNIRNLVCELRG